MLKLSSAGAKIVMFCFAALALYAVKYRVQDIQKDLASVRAELKKEDESIHMLRAEWAYLVRPDGLERLRDNYLKLKPYSVNDMISFERLPDKVQQVAVR